MRTTITLAPDVAAEVERRRREDGTGPSDAVNDLARRGMSREAGAASSPFRQESAPLGARVDLTNVADVLDLLDHG